MLDSVTGVRIHVGVAVQPQYIIVYRVDKQVKPSCFKITHLLDIKKNHRTDKTLESNMCMMSVESILSIKCSEVW